MGDLVNLNQSRKLRQKAKKRAEADENAVKFGRTKAQKSRDKALADKAASALDGHRLNRHPRDDDG